MRFKIFFPLAALVLFAVVGCQKDGLETPVFVEKTFFPKGEAEAKTKVKAFLAIVETSKKGNTERTTFSDTEVNEGRWVLVGSANYEKNINRNSGVPNEVLEFSFDVDNIIDNGILKMSGSDMINEYNSLISLINSNESILGKLASSVQLTIQNTSNTKTSLVAKVAYEESFSATSIEWISYIDAANRITTGVNSIVNNYSGNGCVEWIPDMQIIVASVQNLECTSSGSQCTRSTTTNAGNPNALDYDRKWVDLDVPTAIAVASNWVDENLNSTNPTQQYPWDLEGVWMGVNRTVDVSTGLFTRKSHNIPVLYASQVGWCY